MNHVIMSSTVSDEKLFRHRLTLLGLFVSITIVVAGGAVSIIRVDETVLDGPFDALVVFFVVSKVALFADIRTIVEKLFHAVLDGVWFVGTCSLVQIFNSLNLHDIVRTLLTNSLVFLLAGSASVVFFEALCI